MKSLLSLPILFVAASIACADAPKKLTVHEWGVFRVHEDVEMANADLRALWDNLPEFVYGHIRGRLVPQHWGAVEIRDRPILFLYSPQPAHFTLKVDFPGGMPGVWWPGTQVPAVFGNQKQPAVSKFLQWEVSVKQPHAEWYAQNVKHKEIEKGHWFSRLREVKADDIYVRFGPGGHYIQREKFIYYDGLFPQGKWVKIDVDKDNVTLTNRVKHAVFDVTVIDARGVGDGKIRVGRLDKLDAGVKDCKIAFAEVDAARFASEASETLTKQLIAAGLFDGEAKSLVDLWRKEMFETPGLHVFYRLPREEYDRLLPLTLSQNADVVRVGLIYHGHVEPNLPEQIVELVKQLDSPRFATRDAAKKKLLAYGPAALVYLQKLKKTDLSTEVWMQVSALIKQWHARVAFE